MRALLRRPDWLVLLLRLALLFGMSFLVTLFLSEYAPASPFIQIFDLDKYTLTLLLRKNTSVEMAFQYHPKAALITSAGFHQSQIPIDFLVVNGKEISKRLLLNRPIFAYNKDRVKITSGYPGSVEFAFAAGPYITKDGPKGCERFTPKGFCQAHVIRRVITVDDTGRYLLHAAFTGNLLDVHKKILGRINGIVFVHGMNLDGGQSATGPIPVRMIITPRSQK